jgi:hypothetical protein
VGNDGGVFLFLGDGGFEIETGHDGILGGWVRR